MKCQERKELAKSGLLQWMQVEKFREKRFERKKNIILFTILVGKSQEKARIGLIALCCPWHTCTSAL